MKGLKNILITLLVLLVALFLIGLWYTLTYSMEQVAAYEVNTPDLQTKLLIATQGSEFKDSITNRIIAHYRQDSIYIKVIDVTDLDNIEAQNFDALVIIHTWENWKPPESVRTFIEENRDSEDRITVMTTSGEGSYKMDGVDAIVGESDVLAVPEFVDKIIKRTDILVGTDN